MEFQRLTSAFLLGYAIIDDVTPVWTRIIMAEVYGVFEGGRVRGTALVGAVAAAEERQITFREVAGSSAGAIVASLLAAGYNAGEMRTLLTETNFKDFKDPISTDSANIGTLLTGAQKTNTCSAWIAKSKPPDLAIQRER